MLGLAARRARAQWPLLAALLAVVTAGATLLGVCALLVTRTAERATEVAAARAGAADVDVTAYAVTVGGPDARAVAADARAVLTAATAPFPARTTASASSALRALPAGKAETYLSAREDLSSAAELIAGRWPRPGGVPLEAVLLESTARLLGVEAGAHLRLGPELGSGVAATLDVTVVGLARPRPAAGWDRDPLAGAGYAGDYEDSHFAQPVSVFGPVLVDLADLLAGAVTVDRIEVTAHPDLSAAHHRDLDTLEAGVAGADRALARAIGGRAQIERIGSNLPRTLQSARDQRAATAAVVLAVAVLGGVLAAVALALAGRLTTATRAGETALLTALGTGRARLAATAAAESLAVALLAAALAVPASSALHAVLTRVPPLSSAALAAPVTVTGVQVLVVLAGALAFAAVLVTPAVRGWFDLLLVPLAGLGFWQLYTQPPTGTRADAIRMLAPAALLTAFAALAVRATAALLRPAERLAARARGLVLPLAAFEAARRPRAVAAGLLVALTCATATFGLGFAATWQRSQHDQADLAVGTDLAVTLAAPPSPGQSARLAAATGGTVSPATNRGVAIGQWLGGAGDTPRLVAVDTTRAGSSLRGALAPASPAEGVAVAEGAVLTIAGTADGLTVAPRLVLQDPTGLRTSCGAPPMPLDGTPHPLPGCARVPGLRLVAVALPFAAAEGDGFAERRAVSVTLAVPGAAAVAWTAGSAPPSPAQLIDPAVTADGARLTMTATVQFTGAQDAARTLVATAFPIPAAVPVAVSARLADELHAGPGTRLTLTVGTTPVPVVVAAVVPAVPAAPGAVAVLADLDTLSRALAGSGDLTYPIDAWWVGHPAPGAADRAAALGLGPVLSRAGETDRLTQGPLRASLPAALRLIVPAAVVLLLAGVALHVVADLRERAVELARLRGLGVSRRGLFRLLTLQHGGVLFALLLAGAAAGALVTYLAAPLLVRSETGAAPFPAAVPLWPWPAELALFAAMLLGCLLTVTLVTAVQVRRADAAHLRMAS